MTSSRGLSIAVAGLVAGLLAFVLTGTFHWAYLAALGSMFWLFCRAPYEETTPPKSPTEPTATHPPIRQPSSRTVA